MDGVAPMAVEQQQPCQTYVPPETRSIQEAIETDIQDKAKAAARSQADKAAGGKQSPPRSNSPQAVAAALKANPPRAPAV